jgi:hypothetical protein
MKRARKILAQDECLAPTVCLPVISKERLGQIKRRIPQLIHEGEFFKRIVNYWLMKRYSRHGVPLLRRLQISTSLKINNNNSNNNSHKSAQNSKVARLIDAKSAPNLTEAQRTTSFLLYFRQLRQDLEKTRILMELVLKRERLKLDQVRLGQVETCYELNRFNGVLLQKLLAAFCDLDKQRFFWEPVDPKYAPNYYEEIEKPMSFRGIQQKIDQLEYKRLAQFEEDIYLIVKNCCQYNSKATVYYKTAVRLNEQAGNVFKQVRLNCEIDEEEHF